MLIFKILTADQLAALMRDGRFEGAPVDLADGYLHFSNAAQVKETAAKHFAGQKGLALAAVEAEGLGEALRWEPSRGGDLFPHLYRPLGLDDVLWVKPLPLEGGAHLFPAGIDG